MKERVLYRTYEDNEKGTSLRLVVPWRLEKEVMEAVHNAPLSGHLGVKKIIKKLTPRFYLVSHEGGCTNSHI